MRIAQVSDIHISADGGPFDGFDVRENFLRVLSEIATADYDLLVLSGDLAADEGHFAAYPWIREQIECLPIPALVMAGNHDDPRALAESFGLLADSRRGSLVGKRVFDGVAVYGLDTSSDSLPPCQLQWLEEDLAAEVRLPIVFTHHPPVHCGCRFMDRYFPLRGRERVWRRLLRAGIEHVFCGHYHTYKVAAQDGAQVVICPSTAMQLSQTSPGFAVEREDPGYLEITWEAGVLRWQVHYCPRD